MTDLHSDQPTFEANWEPLAKVARHLHGQRDYFMFMMSCGGLHYYKHSGSRSYLVLDDDGIAYGEESPGRAVPVGIEYAVRRALGDLHPEQQTVVQRAWWPGWKDESP